MAYEFTVDSFREFSDHVLAGGGDQATLTTVLADMQNVFTDNVALQAKQVQDIEALQKENKRLKEANMELFLRIGSQAQDGSEPGPQPEPQPVGVDGYLQRILKEDK